MKYHYDRIAALALFGALACSGSAGNGARADSAGSRAVAGATAESVGAQTQSARTESAKRTRAEGFTIGGDIPEPRTVDSAASR